MATTTRAGHVSRALDFYTKPSIFMGIGRTTPWANESLPPTPLDTDILEEILTYKKVESIFLVKPDEAGALSYRGSKWGIVPPESAITEGARWVYLSTFLSYDEVSTTINYRQVGVFTGLERQADVPVGKYVLSPLEVLNQGILEVLDNRPPIYRDPDQREQLVMIIEF